MNQNYNVQTLQNLQNQIQQLSQLMGVQPPQNNPVFTPTPPQAHIQTVNGIEGARAFQIGPNSSVALFDNDDEVFYSFSTDANGVRSKIKVCRFTVEDEPTADSVYVTKKDFEDLKADIMRLVNRPVKKESDR